MQGQTAIGTRLGTSLTFIAGVIVLIYALAKFTDISTVRGQSISYFEEENVASSEAMNLQAQNFRIALAFEGYNDQKLKNDGRYVR